MTDITVSIESARPVVHLCLHVAVPWAVAWWGYRSRWRRAWLLLLAGWLIDAGNETGERLWRLPLGPKYDKMIESKVADIKNTGGKWGGSISAAQFLQRFVKERTPWAHLDIAGTAMSSVDSDVNRSWGSGFGVRLLDQLVRDHYERG